MIQPSIPTKVIGLCAGDISDLFLMQIGDTPAIIKQARNMRDNDLLAVEAHVLTDLMVHMLKDKVAKEKVSHCIPQLIAKRSSADNQTAWANVLEFFAGYLSVEDIRKLTTGIDGRTLVWMWKRLLVVLSWVHHFGYIHGAVLPPHVLYWPDGKEKEKGTHTVKLVDWCYAIGKKEYKLRAWLPDYKDFYPPEVRNKYIVTPATDLYMAASTMVYLTGGDVANNKFGSKIPGQLKTVIGECLRHEANERPKNIGEHFDLFAKTALDVYGPRKFHEFKLPL